MKVFAPSIGVLATVASAASRSSSSVAELIKTKEKVRVQWPAMEQRPEDLARNKLGVREIMAKVSSSVVKRGHPHLDLHEHATSKRETATTPTPTAKTAIATAITATRTTKTATAQTGTAKTMTAKAATARAATAEQAAAANAANAKTAKAKKSLSATNSIRAQIFAKLSGGGAVSGSGSGKNKVDASARPETAAAANYASHNAKRPPGEVLVFPSPQNTKQALRAQGSQRSKNRNDKAGETSTTMEGRETTMERRQGVNGGRPEGGADRRNDVQLSEYSRMLDAARSTTRAGGKTNKLKQEGRGQQTQRLDPDGRVAAIAADLEASCRAASKDPRTGAKRMKIVSTTTTSSTGDDDQDQIMLSEPVDLVINWFPSAPQSSVQSSSVKRVGSAARADDEKDSTKAGDKAGEEHLRQSGENPIASFLEQHEEQLQTKNKLEKKKKLEHAVKIENNSEILYLLRSAEKHGLFEKVNGMNIRNVWVAINRDALERFGAPRHFEYGVEKLDGSGRKHQINLVTDEDVVPEAEQGVWNDPNVLGDLQRTEKVWSARELVPFVRRSLRTQWIHHIPGLSRYFIFMPDDTLFVGGSVSGAVFFSKDAGGSVPGKEAEEEENPLQRHEDDGHQQHHVAEGGGSFSTSYFATPVMYRYGDYTDSPGHGPVLIDSCVYSRLADASLFVPQVHFESLVIYQNTMMNVLGAKAVPPGGKGPGQQRTFYQECHTNDIWWHPCRHPPAPHGLSFVMNIQGNGISDEYPKDRTIQAEWQSWYHREFAAKSMFEHGGGRGDEAEFPALVLAQSRVEPTSASSSPTAATAPGLSKGAVSSVRVQHQSRYGEESIKTPLFTWNAGAWKKSPTWSSR